MPGENPHGHGAASIALYDFREADGPVVKDRSGTGQPVDLRIENLKAVRRTKGALEVRGKTVIRSDEACWENLQCHSPIRGTHAGSLDSPAENQPHRTRPDSHALQESQRAEFYHGARRRPV